jgi:glycosyltransferase involved in cell wall biosynthesis
MTRILMAEATDFQGTTQVGSHALARQFVAAGAAVMWIGTPLYPHTLLYPRDDSTRRRIDVFRRRARGSGGVTEYYPLTLLPVMNRPLLRSRLVAKHTLHATIPPLAGTIRRHGFADPDVLWLSASRFSYPLMKMVRARRRAYRMSDDWAAFPEVPRSLIDLESRIIDAVDAVFVTGRVLEVKVRARRPDVIYLPNAVEEEFFEEAPLRPDDGLDGRPRPRVIFVGTLGDWIDYEAIARTARRCPQAQILLVGEEGSARGREFPGNVHLRGRVPYARLPAVLRACDVGIVPFLRTPRTEAASSNKVFQYLAAGLPVVTTRTTEIELSGAPVSMCDRPDEFADAVAAAIEAAGAGRAARVEYARQHTWTRRMDVIRVALEF